MPRGCLIVFEGPEGAGKTTQLRLLAERLEKSGRDVLALREPGGTTLGDAIRGILLDPSQLITPAAEALLFMGCRAEIVTRRVDPALNAGVIVLMDRFFLSTYAYQIAGRGLDEEQVREANALATGGRIPDLTIVIDLSAGVGLSRAAARGSHDRMEQSGDEFHSKVSSAFVAFAEPGWQKLHPECGPIIKVDGHGSPVEVQQRVASALAQNLPQQFAMLSDAPAS